MCYLVRKTCDNNPVTSVTERRIWNTHRIQNPYQYTYFFVLFLLYSSFLLYTLLFWSYTLLLSQYNPSESVETVRQWKRYFHSIYFFYAVSLRTYTHTHINTHTKDEYLSCKWALRDSSTRCDVPSFVQHHIQQRRDWLSNVCKNHAWLYGLLLVCNRLLYTSFI